MSEIINRIHANNSRLSLYLTVVTDTTIDSLIALI